MGYPMTWSRLISRNTLAGNYTHLRWTGAEISADLVDGAPQLKLISGDMRRLEQDSVDGQYATQCIAERAGVDIETVIKVLRAFFEGAPALPPHDPFTHTSDGRAERE